MKKIILNIAFAMGTILLLSQCKKDETNLPVSNLKVSFDSTGGSAVADMAVPAGTPFAAPPAPTKANLTFGAWCTEAQIVEKAEGKPDKIKPGKAFDFKGVIQKNITLYARWDAQVTLNGNGGKWDKEETSKSQFPILDPTVTKEPKVLPVQTGKRVKGWSTKADGSAPYTFGQTLTQNIELFAIWEDSSVTEGDFIFDKLTATITGLSAAGLAKTSLVAPSAIQGFTITNIFLSETATLSSTIVSSSTITSIDLSATEIKTLKAGSFPNKLDKLATLLLPKSLESIEDKVFDGLKVTDLTLKSNKPPKVGTKNGLDVSTLTIRTPAGYLGFYEEDAFWKTAKTKL
ncbi:MAG: InlB B-repeat-containing protein [Sphingobacteriaceae bacterium]|nr:InlB B-repeat-containing protein [Sphingobacteriaceae bacterium]